MKQHIASLIIAIGLPSSALAQGLPTQPVFPSVNPGVMVWEQGKASGGGRVCGQTYSDDNEKAALLEREARGLCGVQSSANAPTLRFTPDLALRKALTAQFAKTLGGGDPTSPPGRFVASGEAFGAAQRQLSAFGLSPNDISDITALFFASHWSLARGKPSLPPKSTVQAVKAQLASMLSVQPAMTGLTDAAKQRQADPMLILTAVSLSENEKAKGNPAAREVIAASATRLLKGMGFDPAKFDLTTQGMVPVK